MYLFLMTSAVSEECSLYDAYRINYNYIQNLKTAQKNSPGLTLDILEFYPRGRTALDARQKVIPKCSFLSKRSMFSTDKKNEG